MTTAYGECGKAPCPNAQHSAHWRIEDVVAVCEGNGIACTASRKGSHNKVKHVDMAEILTVPAHRPIKPVYVRELVRFVDVVRGGKE